MKIRPGRPLFGRCLETIQLGVAMMLDTLYSICSAAYPFFRVGTYSNELWLSSLVARRQYLKKDQDSQDVS